jgi:phospho-N-acetylmuramoyl-pentapeptide-transferase
MGTKKLFHRKVLVSAPMHNHLQAIGWPEAKVTMRMWIVSIVFAMLGVIVYFTGIAS